MKKSPPKPLKYLAHPYGFRLVIMHEALPVDSSRLGKSRVTLTVKTQLMITRFLAGSNANQINQVSLAELSQDVTLEFEVVAGDDPE